jgi:hypothetical protein
MLGTKVAAQAEIPTISVQAKCASPEIIAYKTTG